MSLGNDPRTRELIRLKLALATFALRLDAFEQQARGLLRSIGQFDDPNPPRRGIGSESARKGPEPGFANQNLWKGDRFAGQ